MVFLGEGAGAVARFADLRQFLPVGRQGFTGH
jgi:hypothetical protein